MIERINRDLRGLQRVGKVMRDRMRGEGDEVRVGSESPEVSEQVPVYDHGSVSTSLWPIIHRCFSKALTQNAVVFKKSYLPKQTHSSQKIFRFISAVEAPCGHELFIALLELSLSI
jgi:hypothetical protein